MVKQLFSRMLPLRACWKSSVVFMIDILARVEGDRGAGIRENTGGRWTGSGRRQSGMRESCEGGRRMRDIKFLMNF